MKNMSAKELAEILLKISQMIERSTKPDSYEGCIDWSYIEKYVNRNSIGQYLELRVQLRAGGEGNSNPIVCQDIARMIEDA